MTAYKQLARSTKNKLNIEDPEKIKHKTQTLIGYAEFGPIISPNSMTETKKAYLESLKKKNKKHRNKYSLKPFGGY